MKKHEYIWSILIALLITTVDRTASADPAENRAIIVLDASGSMKQKIEGKAKIDIARGVIDELLVGWDKKTELGIAAYGHRDRNSCNDIETIVPVGKVNRKTVMSAVNALDPKGRTPISAAVQAAAEELKYTKNKATIILVSDGKETCSADPCKLVEELEKKGIDFTVHVVGFGIRDAEKSQLSCLAKNTGGQFLLAKNAKELNQAMKQTVAIVTTRKPDTEVGSGLTLHAVAIKGAEPLTSGLYWRFFEAKKGLDGKRKYVYAACPSGSCTPKLTAGRYLVRVEYDQAFAEKEIEVKTNARTEETLVLNAGVLKLNAVPKMGANPIESDLYWTIYEGKQSIDGKRNFVVNRSQKPYTTKLSAGRYFVKAQYDQAVATAEVEVKANEMSEKTLVLNAGALKLNALIKKGGDRVDRDLYWTIYEGKQSIDGKRNLIVSRSQTPCSAKLNAGRYFVKAQYDQAAATAEVEVKANEMTEETLILNAGALKLDALIKNGGVPIDRGINWKIYKAKPGIDGRRDIILSRSTVIPTINLPEGKYYVEAKYEKVSTGEEVEVKAGELTKKTLIFTTK
ncbi:MAG: VWA domain-containing protein [Deltaproteobacteria bacterium]|nr:VWA domain-containing protein [Deltaproteobacteria bacterium]